MWAVVLSFLQRVREICSDWLAAGGRKAAARRETESAIRWFSAALWVDPANLYAIYGRAIAFEQVGLFERAIRDYSEGLALEPNDFSAHLSRAALYIKLGDLAAAKKDLDDGVRLNRGESEAPYARGAFHMDAKEYDLAIADFTSAISADGKRAEAYLKRGISHHVSGHLKQAIEDYSSAINIDPDYIFSLVYCGKFLEWDRQKLGLASGEAPQRLGPNIRLEPCLATAFFNRGVAYFHLGEPQTALADFRQAFELDPSYAWPHRKNA